ncbi:MAG: YhjD/YihY/BrkB family envelope integrity protein, partial [Bryobacteraceae bacterium]
MADSVGTSTDTARSGAQPQFLIIEPGLAARNFWLLRRAFVASYEDNCFSIAKGAAYSFLLSLFPILTTLTSILIQVNARPVVHVIATFVQQVVPPGTEDIILSRLRERGAKPISLPVVAVLLSLWAGSGAMISLMEGFHAAYRIPSGRQFLKQRAMAVFLVLIAAFPAIAASSLILFGDRGEAAFIHWIGVSDITA